MDIRRMLQNELEASAIEYPVVTVLGPRQSGKTTLVRMTFPALPYRLLEAPDVRLLAEEDPRGFLSECPDGAVLDEVQRVPELLSYIQEIVDDPQRSVRFVLTGSHQPELHQAISQTLAGRTAILNLMPFSVPELAHYGKHRDVFELCHRGCFPAIHDRDLDPRRFFSGYVQTYVERDVRSLMNLRNIGRFQAFLRLLAGRVGQLVSLVNLAGDVGVSSTTIRAWIDVMKASYMVFELPPYFENLRKRVVRSSKLYFTDTGLVCYLLGIDSADQLRRDPLRGSIHENFVVMEVVKDRLNKGLRPDMFFFRDSHGNEVDLIVPLDGVLQPVEIKSASTFHPDLLKGMDAFRRALGERCGPGLLLYNGEMEQRFRGVRIMNPLLHGGFGMDAGSRCPATEG
jgi:predicted AAA+ superfamily ATPase